MIRRAVRYILNNSLLLMIGAAAALIWANLDANSYYGLLHFKLFKSSFIGTLYDGQRWVDVHFFINDVLMALFFAMAGREVWDAVLPGGPLSGFRRASVPLICAVGGMAGPSVIYLAGAAMLGEMNTLGHGWAIPCATDIAFSYMVARVIFGTRHPAVTFLLMLAIVDDALGMAVLAVFYPQGELQFAWLLLPVAASVAALLMHRLRIHNFWWYLLPLGAVSWLGFALAGIHPALGLLPIIPMIPHAKALRRHVGWDVLALQGSWDKFGAQLKTPVELILGVFGLCNAGVVLNQTGNATWLVMIGLLAGKPIGIFVSGIIGMNVLKVDKSQRLHLKDLAVVGFSAGIGFTVALFVATVAFPSGPIQDAAKIGALSSFLAAVLSWIVAKMLGVRRMANGTPKQGKQATGAG